MSVGSWLKSAGLAIYSAAEKVVGFLSSSKVQNAEQSVAAIAELLLPAEAPIIATFQDIAGKIFRQSIVTETAFANVAGAGTQKLSAVLAAVGPELDAWIQNNFPGSQKLSDAAKAGLVNAVVAIQNELQPPPSA